MKRRTWTVSIVVLACALWAIPTTAAADSPSLSGTYELNEDASDEMVKAFKPAIDEMSRLRRGFARRAVRDADNPSEQITIDVDDDEVVIDSSNEPTRTIPFGGERIDHTNDEGDEVQLRARMKGDELVVYTDREDGEIESTYRLESNGDRLAIVSDIDIEDLPKEVTYRLYYERR